MRALLPLAAALAGLAFAGPVLAREDGEAARCAAQAARLDKPLNDPSGRGAFRFWNLYIERYEPIPYDAAAISRKVAAQCGDDDLRTNAWSFIVNMLAASGDLDGALAAAEERLRLSPSGTAWKELAQVRLRRGDEAGALTALGHGTPPTSVDPRAVARLYDQLPVELDSTPPAALAVLQAGERSWRAAVRARPEPENTIRLAALISRQGVPLERTGDYKSAAEVYARVEAELAPLRAAQLDGFDERGVQAVLRNAYVSRARASARAGDRAAMLDSAGKALPWPRTTPSPSPTTGRCAARSPSTAGPLTGPPAFPPTTTGWSATTCCGLARPAKPCPCSRPSPTSGPRSPRRAASPMTASD